MRTTPEQINIWRKATTETQRLEFKEAKTQFDNRKLYKYCVALANEGGGQLLLGISDQPPRPVVGTASFNNPTHMAEKLFTAVGFRVDIEEVLHPDGRVLVFHIPSRPRGTEVILYGHQPFEKMDREARIRACYQHCVLQYVLRRQMTNQSLRGRFRLPERRSAVISQIIAATIEAGLIKADEKVGKSKKYARYLPVWA